jgi:hypothetical protein
MVLRHFLVLSAPSDALPNPFKSMLHAHFLFQFPRLRTASRQRRALK